MKIKTIPQEDHQVKLVVEPEIERMDSARRRAARQIAERGKISGFRPGKVPYDIVLRQYGEAAITEEALEILVNEIYPEAIDQAKVSPSGPGTLEEVGKSEPPTLTFIVPLEPSVDLGDYKNVRIPYEWQAPDDTLVTEALEEMRRMHSTTETVDRAVQEGDFVLADIKGSLKGSASTESVLIDRPGFPAYVSSKTRSEEWPYPGFSKHLVNLLPGESKEISHKFPSDHADENLQGKSVSFEITVKAVRSVTMPDLNDEFAKKVGSFADLSALRDVVRANLEQRSKNEYDDTYFTRVLDAVIEGAQIKYPPQILSREIEIVLQEFEERLASQGWDVDTYIKSQNTDRQKFVDEEVRPAAIKRLERSLVLDELARAENIQVTQDALNASFQETWLEIQSSENYQKSMRGKTPPKRLLNAIAMQSAGRAITQHTLERLKSIATGQKKADQSKPAESQKPKSQASNRTGTKKAKTTPKKGSTNQ